MDDTRKTRAQLLREVTTLRQQVADLKMQRTTSAEAHRQAACVHEARLNAIVESAVDGIITIDEQGRIESFNSAAEQLFGYRSAAVIGQDIAMLIPLPYREAHDSYLRRYLQTSDKRIIGTGREVPGQRRDGSTFPIELAVGEGRLSDRRGFTGIVRDLSERKQAEAALQHEKTFVESLLDTAQVIILVLDRRCRIVRFNAYLEALSGYPLADVQGQDWITTFLPARDWNRVGTVFEQSVGGFPTRGNVNPIVTKTGQERQIEWFDTRLTDASGEVTGLLSVGHDITERLDGEVMLREREHQLQLLADSLPVLISYVDANQRYRFNNLAYERWFGLPRMAVYGKHIAAVLGRQAYATIRPHIERALTGQTVTYEDTVPCQQGGKRVVRATYVPDRDDAGPVHGFFALVSDITEHRRMEVALRQSEHLALLGRLAASVSHELRNPLNAIFLHMDIIEEELQQPSPDSQAQIRESVAEIKIELPRMQELMDDYLSMARLSAMQREQADLGSFVKACVQEKEEQLASRGIILSLGGLASLGEVAFHPNTMRRALANLMQNALEAMPEGGRLSIRGQRTRSHVHLEISDTGVGIPEDELPLIFEPLHTTKPDGTGLGLYLVQEIVAAHEGRIDVHSMPSAGTTFTLTLPCAGWGHHPDKARKDLCLGGKVS